MIESGVTYLPQDRRIALARGEELAERVSGAALLADISGFTPLTEALTRDLGPRRGIEELAAQINRIYDALIGEVERGGGSVVGFAGDAMVCWFDGRDEGRGMRDEAQFQEATSSSLIPHPASLRAVACALALQGAMGAFAALPLPQGGTVTIGIKVAVASGPARRYAVGEPAVQLIDALAGATIARTGAGERLAQRGEVLVDEATAARLGDQLRIGEWRGAGSERYGVVESLLAPAPPAPPLSDAAPDETRFRAWLLPAVYDRLLDGLGEFLTELRPAVALFLSFEGIDYDDDPQARAKLDRLIRTTQAIIGRYGGTLLQLTIGDKGSYSYAAFGAPISHEDNARRAVAAALELRGLASELRFLQPVRIGLSQGIMRSGAYGGATRRTYGVLGDEVNLAARLMQQAAPGEVLASGRVREQAGAAFAWESLPPVRLKGKREPVPLARLLGAQTPTAVTGRDTPLVGREAELAQLVAAARPIFTGRFAGVAALFGEPGMGKSRLVVELRRRLGSAPRARRMSGEIGWLSLLADEILRQSLNPFRTFLRAYLDQQSDAPAQENGARADAALDRLIAAINALGGRRRATGMALAAELARTRSFLAALVGLHQPGSLYEQLEPKLRFENTLAALKALVLAESLRRPLVLHIEDAQWLDDDSRTALRLLTRNVAEYPFLVLVTSRFRDDGAPVDLSIDEGVPLRTVALGALNADGVRQVAAQVLGGTVADDLAALLVTKTGGNPFFAEQLALDLRERELLATSGDPPAFSLRRAAAVEVPDTISAVLIARLDRLAARVKAVVQTAAVLGQEFEVRLLAGMLRDDPTLPERVREAERETIWTALSELRYLFRHALLRDAAYDMQLRSRLRELHRVAAEVIEQIHAADLPASSADLAYHYGRAEDTPRERRFARMAGDYAAARYANADAAHFFGRALELTPEADGPARYTLLLAREQVYDLQGARDVQRADLAALADLAEQLDDPARRAETALREARHADVTGDYPAMIAAAQWAIELAQAIGAPSVEAAGHLHWARALWYQGNYIGVQAQASRALTLARGASERHLEADSQRILGNAAMYQGSYEEARMAYEAALVIHRALGDRRSESATRGNLGIVSWYQGDYTAAREAYAYDLQIKRELGDRYGQSLALLNLGEVAAVQGDYLGAQGYYAEALRLKRETGDRYGESVVLASLGDIQQTLGDYLGARAGYEAALALTDALGHRQQAGWVQARLGLLQHQQREHAAALHHAEQSLALARAINDRNTLGYALTLRGHALAALDRPTEAAEAYRDSLELRRTLQQPNLAAECLAGLADLTLAAGDTVQAGAHVAEILAQLEAGTLDGADEPFRVFLTCHRVLRAAADERAGTLLPRARAMLLERAARIGDEGARRVFLERVPSHRELMGAEE
jgi:class 3 adenylate cyclase/tetratricopeptide (TPR) repeat protein